jgi:hypothetical protein
MINKDIKPELSQDIVWKEEGENNETVSLASYIGGPIRFLNPVASKIIKLSDGKHTVREIINKINESFEDSDPEKIEKDVEKFLKQLEKKKIIKPLKIK